MKDLLDAVWGALFKPCLDEREHVLDGLAIRRELGRAPGISTKKLQTNVGLAVYPAWLSLPGSDPKTNSRSRHNTGLRLHHVIRAA